MSDGYHASTVHGQCGEEMVKALPGDGPEIIVRCQRDNGHPGKHAALWLNGFIQWWRDPFTDRVTE